MDFGSAGYCLLIQPSDVCGGVIPWARRHFKTTIRIILVIAMAAAGSMSMGST
jgi:hypothetical protein